MGASVGNIIYISFRYSQGFKFISLWTGLKLDLGGGVLLAVDYIPSRTSGAVSMWRDPDWMPTWNTGRICKGETGLSSFSTTLLFNSEKDFLAILLLFSFIWDGDRCWNRESEPQTRDILSACTLLYFYPFLFYGQKMYGKSILTC